MTDETKIAIDNAKREIRVATEEAMRKIALRVMQTLVLATPVDTGRARSNWIVSLGSPARATKEPMDKSGAAAISENATEIATHKDPSVAIYISNNLPYIGRLNEGWSKQAPAGYVEQALQAARSVV